MYFDKPIALPETFSEWFDPYPHLHVENVSGMAVQKKGLVMGTRAGPSYDADFLCHEMAHMIEATDSRVLRPAWGMRYRTVVEINGVLYEDPITPQGCFREIRTFGIQQVLCEMLGVVSEPHGSLLQYQLDYIPFLVELGLDASSTESLEFRAREKLAEDVANHLIALEAQKWSRERVWQEWHRKASVVEEAYEQAQ